MRSPTRTVRVGIAAAVAAATLLSPAAAGAADSYDQTDGVTAADEVEHLRPRLRRICHRVDHVEVRANRVLARIDGDETTRGSLAWLDARIARAQDEGRDDLALVLQNRRNTRAKAREVVELRLVEVETIQGLCDEHGYGQ